MPTYKQLAKRLGTFRNENVSKLEQSALWQDIKAAVNCLYIFINHFALDNDIYESINSENPCRISKVL